MSSKIKKAAKKKPVATALIVVEEHDPHEAMPVEASVVEPQANGEKDDAIYQDALSFEDRANSLNELKAATSGAVLTDTNTPQVPIQTAESSPQHETIQNSSMQPPEPIESKEAPLSQPMYQSTDAISQISTEQPPVPPTIQNHEEEEITMVRFEKKAVKPKRTAAESKTMSKKKKPLSGTVELVTEVANEPSPESNHRETTEPPMNSSQDNLERQQQIKAQARLLAARLSQEQSSKVDKVTEKEAPKTQQDKTQILVATPPPTEPPTAIDLLSPLMSAPRIGEQNDQNKKGFQHTAIDLLKPVMSMQKIPENQPSFADVLKAPVAQAKPEPSLKNLGNEISDRTHTSEPPPLVEQPQQYPVQVIEQVVVFEKQPKKKPIENKKAVKKPKAKEIKVEEVKEVELESSLSNPVNEEAHPTQPEGPQSLEFLSNTQKQVEVASHQPSTPETQPINSFQEVSAHTNKIAASTIPSNQQSFKGPEHTTQTVPLEPTPTMPNEQPALVNEVAEEMIELNFTSLAAKPKKKVGKEEKKTAKTKPTIRKTERVAVESFSGVSFEAEKQKAASEHYPHSAQASRSGEERSNGQVLQFPPTKYDVIGQSEILASSTKAANVEAKKETAIAAPEIRQEPIDDAVSRIVPEQPQYDTTALARQDRTQSSPESIAATVNTTNQREKEDNQVESAPIQVPETIVQFDPSQKKSKKQTKVKDFKKKKAFATVDVHEEIEVPQSNRPTAARNEDRWPKQQTIAVDRTTKQFTQRQADQAINNTPIQPVGVSTIEQRVSTPSRQATVSTFLQKLELRPCFNERQNQMRQTVCMIKEDILSRLVNRSALPPVYRADETQFEHYAESTGFCRRTCRDTGSTE